MSSTILLTDYMNRIKAAKDQRRKFYYEYLIKFSDMDLNAAVQFVNEHKQQQDTIVEAKIIREKLVNYVKITLNHEEKLYNICGAEIGKYVPEVDNLLVYWTSKVEPIEIKATYNSYIVTDSPHKMYQIQDKLRFMPPMDVKYETEIDRKSVV